MMLLGLGQLFFMILVARYIRGLVQTETER